MRGGDKFEVNFHNIGLPHHVVADGRSKPHAAVVTPTVQKKKGYKRLMSDQECLRLQYGKKYKHKLASPVIGSRKKSAMDDEFFVTGGGKKNCIADYAVRLDVQGGHVIFYGPMPTPQETF